MPKITPPPGGLTRQEWGVLRLRGYRADKEGRIVMTGAWWEKAVRIADIALALDCGKERVRQIEARALRKLRQVGMLEGGKL